MLGHRQQKIHAGGRNFNGNQIDSYPRPDLFVYCSIPAPRIVTRMIKKLAGYKPV
jgi:hypothetical protein